MKSASNIRSEDVTAVYDGPEAALWELLMGQQLHVGGFKSSMDLSERAGIGTGFHGIDVCCCNGAGMRFFVRFRGVASMVGVDASRTMIARGRQRCAQDGLSKQIRFLLSDVCTNGLPAATADFVWGEDAWCYVPDKRKLVAEATRLVKPGGVIAFTDWVEGPAGLSDTQAERFLHLMKFPSLQDIDGYARLLRDSGCTVMAAEDTARFPSHIDLYLNMLEMQLAYDALRIIGFDTDLLGVISDGFAFIRDLAHGGNVAQGRFIARRQ